MSNQYVVDFYNTLSSRYAADRISMSHGDWMCENTHLQGKKFSFARYPFQKAIADDKGLFQLIGMGAGAASGGTEIGSGSTTYNTTPTTWGGTAMAVTGGRIGYLLHHLYRQPSDAHALDDRWKGRTLNIIRHPAVEQLNNEKIQKADVRLLLPPHLRGRFDR